MKNDFCGGFPVRTDDVRRVCDGIKAIFEKEETESKERIDAFLSELPIFFGFGFSIERLLRVRLPRAFGGERRKHLVENASNGTVYSNLLAGEYVIQEAIYDIWYKDRLTKPRDLEKASYLLNAVGMVDSEHVYLETKDASWLGRMKGYLQ